VNPSIRGVGAEWRFRIRVPYIRVLIGIVLMGVAVRAIGAAEPTVAAPAKPRDDLPGLKNFAVVSEALSRGAQPTAEGFAELKRRGVKTIVNLRSAHTDREKLAGTGLQYVEIPCHAWHPELDDVLKFLKVALDPKNQPVFVHCEHGSDRTGMMVAVYRIVEQDWTSDDAVKELPTFHFHPIFGEVVAYLKKFDPAATKKKLEQTTAPKIEVLK
jgi:protein tyrosine/serine phosphatase